MKNAAWLMCVSVVAVAGQHVLEFIHQDEGVPVQEGQERDQDARRAELPQAPAERSAPAAKERPKDSGQATAALAGNKNIATIIAAENSKAASSQQAEIKNNVDVNVHPQEINVYIDKNKVGKAVADYNAKEDKRKGRTR